MESKVFLDTSYAIALANLNDDYHLKSIQLAQLLQTQKIKLVTSRAILLEIGNSLSKQSYRQASIKLLKSLEIDPNVEVITLSEELYNKGFNLYQNRPDKNWGLVDCISFIIMQENKIKEALTTDEHFKQAGFIPLLLV